MDAAGLFTCHSLGPGQQLAGTHSWQRAESWGGAGGGTAMHMDRQTDGWMDGQWVSAGLHPPFEGHLSQQGLVTRAEVRTDSFWLQGIPWASGRLRTASGYPQDGSNTI